MDVFREDCALIQSPWSSCDKLSPSNVILDHMTVICYADTYLFLPSKLGITLKK